MSQSKRRRYRSRYRKRALQQSSRRSSTPALCNSDPHMPAPQDTDDPPSGRDDCSPRRLRSRRPRPELSSKQRRASRLAAARGDRIQECSRPGPICAGTDEVWTCAPVSAAQSVGCRESTPLST
jgi:hypothetical protein